MEKEIRCRSCNRLLLKGRVEEIEIKCPKCGCLQCFFTQDNQMKCYCMDAHRKVVKLRLHS